MGREAAKTFVSAPPANSLASQSEDGGMGAGPDATGHEAYATGKALVHARERSDGDERSRYSQGARVSVAHGRSTTGSGARSRRRSRFRFKRLRAGFPYGVKPVDSAGRDPVVGRPTALASPSNRSRMRGGRIVMMLVALFVSPDGSRPAPEQAPRPVTLLSEVRDAIAGARFSRVPIPRLGHGIRGGVEGKTRPSHRSGRRGRAGARAGRGPAGSRAQICPVTRRRLRLRRSARDRGTRSGSPAPWGNAREGRSRERRTPARAAMRSRSCRGRSKLRGTSLVSAYRRTSTCSRSKGTRAAGARSCEFDRSTLTEFAELRGKVVVLLFGRMVPRMQDRRTDYREGGSRSIARTGLAIVAQTQPTDMCRGATTIAEDELAILIRYGISSYPFLSELPR